MFRIVTVPADVLFGVVTVLGDVLIAWCCDDERVVMFQTMTIFDVLFGVATVPGDVLSVFLTTG